MGLANTRFYLDDGTGSFPDDITSYVLLVEGLALSRGRGDTDSSPTAGTLNIVVNNKTGAFTPGSTILGSPTPIKVDQRIRVKETINGTTVTRFTGYVKSWALGWRSTTEASAVVRITATDAQARAERRVLRSVVEEEILPDTPATYYMLAEPEGAISAADVSGNQQPALTMTGSGAAVTFGTATGPGTDSLTAASFAGGQFLTTTLAAAPTALVCYFSTSTTPAASTAMVLMAVANTAIGIDSTGKINSGGTFAGSPVVTNGATHCLVWESGHAYLDGVDLGSPLTPSGTRLEVGGGTISDTVLLAPAVPFTGTMAHVATFGTITSAARALAYYQAGSTGFAGESGTARITRLAGYANLTIGTMDTSLTNVAFADFTGSSAWQAIQEVADAEMGVAYIAGDGTLTFHNRQRVPVKTSPDLTLNGFVTPDAEPTTDDQDLLNYLETSSSATGISQVVRSTTSETTHGRYSDSRTYLVSTDQEALDRANWLIATRAEPAASGRYGTLTVNLFGMTPAQQLAAVQALEHGCWLRVVNMPSQTTGGTTVDVVVEGIAENQSGDGWQIACNVVPKATLYPKVFILDSSVLDGPDLLAV